MHRTRCVLSAVSACSLSRVSEKRLVQRSHSERPPLRSEKMAAQPPAGYAAPSDDELRYMDRPWEVTPGFWIP